VRERVFEPAFYDLLRARLVGGPDPAAGATRFGAAVLGTWLRCLPIALPALVVRRRRLTRLGKWAVATATVAAIVVLILVTQTEYGPGYTP
jgi:hypothetical protein